MADIMAVRARATGVGMAADTVTAAAMVMGTAALSIQVGGAVLLR